MNDALQTIDPIGIPSYQRVRDAIRTDIARGVLEPDTWLKIAVLSSRYGLSPAPIREALGQLAAEGWIVIHPNRGARVRNIDAVFIRELNEIRVAVDSYAAGLAAAAATPAQVAGLEAIEDAYEACLDGGGDAGGAAELVRLNAALHRAIRAIRPNAEAQRLMDRHGAFFNVMRTAWGYSPGRPRQIAEEHRRLLAAFRDNDPVLAERISREHIGHAMEDLLRLRREAEQS